MDCRKHKNISLLAIGLIVICLLVTVGCRKKTEPASPSAVPTTAVSEANSAAANPDDEKTIRQLAGEFTAAFRLDNPTPISRLEEIFADDFCQKAMDGNTIQGKQDNLSFYRSRQEKRRAVLRSRAVYYDIQSVKMSRDLAVVFGEIKGEKWFKNAPKPYMANFWETLVFQKIDGKWYLVQEQSIQPRPAGEQQGASKDEKPTTTDSASSPPAQQEKMGDLRISNFDFDPFVSTAFARSRWRADKGDKDAFSVCDIDTTTGAAGTPFSMKWSYNTKAKDTWVNVGLLLSGSWSESVDLSRYDSISFYIKGAEKKHCTFKIQTGPWKEKILSGAHFPLELTPEWQKVVIDLKTRPELKDIDLTKTYTIELVEGAKENEEKSNVVWIDEIMLRKTIDKIKTNQNK